MTATVFSTALDMSNIVAIEVTTMSPQQLAIITIMPVVFGIRAGISRVAIVQSIDIQNISLCDIYIGICGRSMLAYDYDDAENANLSEII